MGHGEQKFKIPDYRLYKVEDIPELVKLQKCYMHTGYMIRGHVMKCGDIIPKFWGTKRQRMLLTVSRGFKVGLVAALITVVAGKFFGSSDSHHGDHH